MKNILYIILALSFPAIMQAQENPSFFSLNAGTSVPVGKYYSSKLPDGGFAQPGLAVSMEGAWFFRPWLGVGASANMQLHPVDVAGLANERMANDPFINELVIRSEPYLSFGFFAGAYFNLPLISKLSFTGKALGGIMYARTPYQLSKTDYFMIGKDWTEKTSAGDFEASFMAGAGLMYALNPYVGLSLGSEFTYNVMDYTFLIAGGGERTDNLVLSFVNIDLGVVIMLGKVH